MKRWNPLRCQHTKAPEGYVAWHVWAEKKLRTHYQKRCPGCGLWFVWAKRPRPRGDKE